MYCKKNNKRSASWSNFLSDSESTAGDTISSSHKGWTQSISSILDRDLMPYPDPPDFDAAAFCWRFRTPSSTINTSFFNGYHFPVKGIHNQTYTKCFKKSSPLKLFRISSLWLSFCVKFCKFVGNSYPHISINFCRFILIFRFI